jgi:hypothetical protein
VSKLVCLTAVLLAVTPYSSQSQSVQVYDAHISKLQKSIPEWRAQIDEIDPAKIVVPYLGFVDRRSWHFHESGLAVIDRSQGQLTFEP